MAYNAKVIEIFLSSPSDVGPERDFIIAEAAEWNRLHGRENGVFLSVLTWELVAPSVDERAQAVINDQIGYEYDVYLGVMWMRIGTPTGTSVSGTVEEFDLALNRKRDGQSVYIANIFKTGSIDSRLVDGDQFSRLQRFKKRLEDEGSFYREFTDERSLRSILSLIFAQIAKRDFPVLREDSGRQLEYPEDQMSTIVISEEIEEDIGLIEIGEDFELESKRFTAMLSKIAEKELDSNTVLQSCTDNMSTLSLIGKLDTQSIKMISNDASRAINTMSDYIESVVGDIEDSIQKMSSLIDSDLRVRLDFGNPRDVAATSVNALKELLISIEESITMYDGLIEATGSLPRISKDISKAKNRSVKIRERLRQSFDGLRNSIINSLSYFDEASEQRN